MQSSLLLGACGPGVMATPKGNPPTGWPRRWTSPDACPGTVALVVGHLLGDFGGFFAEILLINHAGLVDDEGHGTAGAVFRRIGHETEATRLIQYPVVVTVIW